jgi:hypothetical protein
VLATCINAKLLSPPFTTGDNVGKMYLTVSSMVLAYCMQLQSRDFLPKLSFRLEVDILLLGAMPNILGQSLMRCRQQVKKDGFKNLIVSKPYTGCQGCDASKSSF